MHAMATGGRVSDGVIDGRPALDRRANTADSARFAAVFAVVAAGIAMVNLDLFIVNVALPSIGRTFGGADLASLSWVLNAYAIVFAALLVPAGRAADLSGGRARPGARRRARRRGLALGVPGQHPGRGRGAAGERPRSAAAHHRSRPG